MEISLANLFFSYGKKILKFVMKTFIFLLCSVTFAFSTNVSFSQSAKVSIEKDQTVSIEKVFDLIQKNTDYTFAFATNLFEEAPNVKLNKGEILVEELLKYSLLNTHVGYYFLEDTTIVLYPLNTQDTLQQIVSGVVQDEEGIPIPYATIQVSGTTAGVAADQSGYFEINVNSPTATLVISAIGYVSKTVALNNQKKLTITLEVKANELEEVMVYGDGYTKISKERATGSYATVPKQMLENFATQSVGSMLEGVTPGIQTFEDADGNVNIDDVVVRGVGTVDSRQTPLVVVDGFPISGGFSTINPNIIESVTVLKDAAAASIWGARAGNGVIVVTTKKAKEESKLQVNFSTFVSMRDKMDLDYNLNKASSATELEMERFMFQESGTAFYIPYISYGVSPIWRATTVYSKGARAYYDYDQGIINQAELDATIQNLSSKDVYKDIDRYILQSPVKRQYNLDVSSASDRSSTMFSVLYNDNDNAFINDENQQLLINLNNSFKFTDWAELQVGLMLDRSEGKNSGLDIRTLDYLNRYDQLVDDNGNYLPVPYGYNLGYIQDFTANVSGLPYDDLTYNPIREANATEFKQKQNNFRISAALNLDITKDLRLTSSFQYEDFVSKYTQLYEEDSFYARDLVTNGVDNASYDAVNEVVSPTNVPIGGIKSTSNGEMQSYVIRNTLAYDKLIGTNHMFNVFGGFELSSIDNNSNRNTLYGYNDETNSFGTPTYTGWSGLFNTRSYGIPYGAGLTETYQRFLSYFGNFAYTYNDRYTLTGSARSDGANFIVDDNSTRFNPMWSFGLGWNVKRESFMEGVDFLNQLKLRATLGENGNIVGGASQVPVLYIPNSPSTRTGTIGAYILDKGNPDLRWERTRVFNLGTDFTLFNGLFSGSFDYYRKKSYDLVARVQISTTLGDEVQTFNAAEMLNNGYEVNLNANVEVARGLNWFSNIAFAHNDNRTTKFNQGQMYPRSLASGYYDYAEGYAYMPLFSFVYGGVQEFEQADGSVENYPTVEGLNGQTYRWDENIGSAGEEGTELLKYEGTRVAPTVVGWNNTFSFKGVTLRARMIGKFGHKFFKPSASYPVWPLKNQSTYGSHPDWDLMISGEGESQGLPSLPSEYDFYTYRWGWYMPYLDKRVADAAHIRLKEIYLGYDLPVKLMNSMGIQNLRVFAQMENLGNIWTANDDGIDPEYLIGVTRRPEKSFTMGLSVQF
ncbi:TonB-linked outer membrane protein, SusC/RagA family [Zhouia amylolytica]|uniref:TonB-linked outer membrane protein, SusC/RagA family n=2 Tax=Zhouia amylolytica TaxID=376730 RepID=A0A1I6RTE4_9FLAO|nr:TonB-linked outer membrane protein, SusC/RagA family [Zhouia amylolytica]